MRIPEGYREIEAYIKDNSLVVVGYPYGMGELHNCDEMGCGSFSHVLLRAEIKGYKITKETQLMGAKKLSRCEKGELLD